MMLDLASRKLARRTSISRNPGRAFSFGLELQEIAMINFASGKLARIVFIAALACTATLLLADTGSAASRKLSGTYSSGQIKASCDANGGVFSSTGSGGYNCTAGGGIVDCNSKGKCTGYCTKCASVAKGVGGILRPTGSAGTASAAGGGTATKRKIPINNAGGLKVRGGTTSGKH
jgi:hypothetical protein